MSALKELCPHVTCAIMMNAESIGKYWFECDVYEKRDNPGEHVPSLVELQAKLIASEYREEEEVIQRFLTKASKRDYLKRISDHIENA